MINDVIIIGGGASGMMAAITAALRNKKVTIIEHCEKTGKKILMTGNGKCNYSNTLQNVDCYRSSDDSFVNSVLEKFPQKDVTDFFLRNGIATKNRNGYLYPRSGQAAVISEFLREKCEHAGVNIICGLECKSIKCVNGIFSVKCRYMENGEKCVMSARSVIVSTGGMTYQKSGSDGSGYRILSELGHHIINPLPALTPLHCKEKFFKALKGVRCDAKVSLYIDNKFTVSDTGELQLTDYGVSGIPVFQISRYASRALDEDRKVTVDIDFVPEYDENTVRDILLSDNDLSISQTLNGIVNKKISQVILKITGISENMVSKKISTNDVRKIVRQLKSTKVTVTKTGGFEQAQVCCGGVSTDEIDSGTMQSKLIDNLFITGEVMDVDGICGGYNLQWAWSTGYIAGSNC